MTPTRAAVTIDDLSVSYHGQTALHDVSGSFAAGSLTAVYGPNGAGKSTLLSAILGHTAVTGGKVEVPSELRRRVAFLPQRAEIDRSFPIRVTDVVMLGHWARSGGFRPCTRVQRLAGLQALTRVGLCGFERRLIGELSSGQLQRVLFARVLLQDAALILLDEPFVAIDAHTTADLLRVVKQWQSERRTVIAVLHDADQIHTHFPQVLMLARELVAWGSTSAVLTAPNISRVRTIAERWRENAPALQRKRASSAGHTRVAPPGGDS